MLVQPRVAERSIGIVLSAGGLRGAAHLGVLRKIIRHHIPIDVMVGVSAGAIIAAFYAGAGLSVEDMIDEAPTFRGRHIVMHGLAVRAHPRLKGMLRPFCGIIPQRLEQLEAASFTALHHGVRRLGIVCHDVDRRTPRYFSTGETCGVRLADVARASAAVPGVLPPKTMTIGAETVRLADGGLSDSLPVDFARAMGATHVIVSDCRYVAATCPPLDESAAYIRPDLGGIRPLRAPRTALMKAVWRGEAAVTREVIAWIERWIRVPVAS